ncbi:hypothetical protein AKJ51_03575 [candidate division MSBL1 archaeon SCGC-AAA382A20]|uniref:Uncharacterized protein n=1 Tax=candidate division MSBL1 archaeon SCGC-AAA382A20 TaxID=1698280 RepID=A0A133VJD4_9EURY|nr:hypothetical protein AKJ51_03575 [candidate division MSBL1 archaeon SCGC-AAA382A20]
MLKIKNKKTVLIALTCIVALTLIVNTDIASAADPGDSFDTAKEIEAPGEFSGTLDESNDADFYKISLEPGSIIELEFTPDSEDGQKLKFW